MSATATRSWKRKAGFSLVEALIVVMILSVVMGSVVRHMVEAQQRAYTERVKLDQLQGSRDFVDQLVRDIQVSGYPNLRMVDPASALFSPALQSPVINDARLAVGIVKIGKTEIWLEGDVVGDGNVYSVAYKLNGTGTCEACLQRSQAQKVSGSPVTAQSQTWATEINGVQNAQVFQAFKTDGSAVDLTSTIDISNASQAQTIASIRVVQVNLTLRDNTIVDLKTRQVIEIVMQSQGVIQNCSMAATGQGMSC